MDLKELLGEDFKEGMTAEEIATALKTKKFVPSSELDGKIDKAQFDRIASELAEAKKQIKANLTQEEQRTAEEEEKEERLAELELTVKISALTETFTANGYDVKTAKELASATVEGDLNKFSEINAKFLKDSKETLQAQIKKELLDESGGVGGGNPGAEDDEEDDAIKLAKELGKTDAQVNKTAQETLNLYTGGK